MSKKKPQCLFIILGATGDLTKRKLIPAIYKLIEDSEIQNFAIIGAASSQTTKDKILQAAKSFIPGTNQDTWNKIESAFYYLQLDFYNSKNYIKFKKLIDRTEKQHNIIGNKMFYFATLPEHFEVLTKNLAQYNIVKKHMQKGPCIKCKHPWSRIVYEKPFGNDLKSAKKINSCISKLFYENQIFRIDHYLGKELVSNIALARFTNRIFEPLWNNEHIDSVQIILSEKLGVGKRGAFYDKYGAIKDVVQNHMLQILSLIAMEPPAQLTAKPIRDAKTQALKKVKVESVILGQYQSYKKEKNVNPKSTTETFAALKVKIDNKRWENVPFYLKAGKCLNKKETSIHIKFKPVKCLLSKACPTDSNYMTIKIEPDEGFYLELFTKVPRKIEIMPVKMNFCHPCTFGPNTPLAYESLLIDVINGDQSTFVRSDEIEESWKIIEQINVKKLKVYPYKKGSNGPKELEQLDKKIKINWRV